MTLGEVKRSNIIKFQLPCQFQRFLYQTLCVFSQIKENILDRIFILLLGSCPRGGTWGCWGVKNLSVGICDGAPSTAHSSWSLKLPNLALFSPLLYNVSFHKQTVHKQTVCASLSRISISACVFLTWKGVTRPWYSASQ